MIYAINKFGVAFAIKVIISSESLIENECQVFDDKQDFYEAMDPCNVGYEYVVKQKGDMDICQLEFTDFQVKDDLVKFIAEYEI